MRETSKKTLQKRNKNKGEFQMIFKYLFLLLSACVGVNLISVHCTTHGVDASFDVKLDLYSTMHNVTESNKIALDQMKCSSKEKTKESSFNSTISHYSRLLWFVLSSWEILSKKGEKQSKNQAKNQNSLRICSRFRSFTTRQCNSKKTQTICRSSYWKNWN